MRCRLLARREARYGWPADPVWTESNWPAGHPKLVLLRLESGAVQASVLLAGVGATAASVLLALGAQVAYDRRAKRQ